MLNLATIQKISDITEHGNADSLEILHVLGWEVISQKGLHNKGDLVVFIVPDTIVPSDNPYFSFLENKKFRVKTLRLRGVFSQGLVCPLSILENAHMDNVWIGKDVSEILGIRHYEKPVPACLSGEVNGAFPTSLLSITDEENINNYPEILQSLYGKPFYVTAKVDGASSTFIKHKNEFIVCSRNWQITENENNTLWKMARKYDLPSKLPEGYAIQAEICGEGIQKNQIGLKGQDIRVFNVVYLPMRYTVGLEETEEMCELLCTPMVDIVKTGNAFEWTTTKEIADFAATVKYPNGRLAEGIVIRPIQAEFNQKLQKSFSFKFINPKYAEKE